MLHIIRQLGGFSQFVFAIVIIVVSFILDLLVAPRTQVIPTSGIAQSRDPSFNYPMYASTVPTWMLFVLMLAIGPILVILITFFGGRYPRSVEIGHSLVGYVEAIGLTNLITVIIKKSVGRPRPSFYAQCGWSDLLNECTGDTNNVWDSRQSFISGHASGAFSSMTYVALLALFILIQQGVPRPSIVPPLLAYMTALSPLILATFIACTRLVNFRHHYSDVLGGSIVGFAVSHFIFKMHFNKRNQAYPLDQAPDMA